jgi:hypothetical protein
MNRQDREKLRQEEHFGPDPVVRCEGHGCGRRTVLSYTTGGLCPGCVEDTRICEGCCVRHLAVACEQVEDGAWLCKPCADAEHAEAERAEGAGEAMGIHLVEDWRA